MGRWSEATLLPKQNASHRKTATGHNCPAKDINILVESLEDFQGREWVDTSQSSQKDAHQFKTGFLLIYILRPVCDRSRAILKYLTNPHHTVPTLWLPTRQSPIRYYICYLLSPVTVSLPPILNRFSIKHDCPSCVYHGTRSFRSKDFKSKVATCQNVSISCKKSHNNSLHTKASKFGK